MQILFSQELLTRSLGRIGRSNWAYVVLFAATTLLIFPYILSGYAITNGNYLFNFEPWVHYQNKYYSSPQDGTYNNVLSDSIDWPNIYYHIDQLRRAELPLWGANEQLGKPGIFLMNNLLSDPVRLLLWVLFDVPVGLTLEVMLKFFLGCLGGFLYLRYLKVDPVVAAATTIGFAFGTAQVASYLDAFGFAPLALPWLFLLIDKICDTRQWKYSLFFCLGCYYLGSLGAGHVVFFSSFWIAIYCLCRVAVQKEQRLLATIQVMVAGVFAILCFSVYLLPTIEYFRYGINLSYREDLGRSQVLAMSLFNLLFGNIFGHPLADSQYWYYGTIVNVGVFVGFLMPFSLVIGNVVAAGPRLRFHSTFFCLAALVLLFHCYEFSFERVELFFEMLPLFRGNPPQHLTTYFQLFVYLGGALGLDRIWKLNPRLNWRNSVITYSFLIAYLAFAYIAFDSFEYHRPESKNMVWYSLVFKSVLFLALLSLSLRIWLRSRVASSLISSGALLALFIIEAKVCSSGWIPYMKPENWYPPTETTDFLLKDFGYSRVMPLDSVAVPETLAKYGIPVAVGRGSVPRPLQCLLLQAFERSYGHPTQTLFPLRETDLSHPIWKLLTVNYFIGSVNTDIREFDKYTDDFRVMRFKDATVLKRKRISPYGFLVSDAIVAHSDEEIASTFASKAFRLRKNVILDSETHLVQGDGKGFDDAFKGRKGGTLSLIKYEPEHIKYKIRQDHAGYFVLSQYYYPGWQALVDGKEVPIIKAYGFLAAIALPEAGEHIIEFRYTPKSLFLGLTISLVSLALACIFYIFAIQKERRARH